VVSGWSRVSDEAAALYGPGSGMRVITDACARASEKFSPMCRPFSSRNLSPSAARLMEWRANIAGLGRVILATPARRRIARRPAAVIADVLRDPAISGDP